MTDDGFKALLATSMAHDVVDETNVHLCTGNPLPKDIESVCHWLLNAPFAEAVAKCSLMQKTKGYATSDILSDVYKACAQLELPPSCRMYLYDQLAKLEHRLATGTTEELQLTSLVAVFGLARSRMGAAAVATAP